MDPLDDRGTDDRIRYWSDDAEGRNPGLQSMASLIDGSASVEMEAPMTTQTQTNKEVVQRGFDALNDRDREAFVEGHRDDAVLYDGREEIRGIDAIADAEFAYFEAFPDLVLNPEEILVDDNIAAARWTVAGTHEGEFKGIEPTGESFEFSVMGQFRIEERKISEIRLVADQLSLLQQLGVVEPPTR